MDATEVQVPTTSTMTPIATIKILKRLSRMCSGEFHHLLLGVMRKNATPQKMLSL